MHSCMIKLSRATSKVLRVIRSWWLLMPVVDNRTEESRPKVLSFGAFKPHASIQQQCPEAHPPTELCKTPFNEQKSFFATSIRVQRHGVYCPESESSSFCLRCGSGYRNEHQRASRQAAEVLQGVFPRLGSSPRVLSHLKIGTLSPQIRCQLLRTKSSFDAKGHQSDIKKMTSTGRIET